MRKIILENGQEVEVDGLVYAQLESIVKPVPQYLYKGQWIKEDTYFNELTGKDLDNLKDGWVEFQGSSFEDSMENKYRFFVNTERGFFIRRVKR